MRQRAGFTLVELAVVLIIIGLLLSGLLIPLTTQQDMRQQSEAEKQLAEIRDAMIGFAQVNKRLPCPARDVASPGLTTGTEDCTAGNNYGVIPWRDLGVKSSDPWGRLIRYRVSPSYRMDITTTTVESKTLAELVIRTRQGGALIDLTNATEPNVAAVIYSHGKTGFGNKSDNTDICRSADGSACPGVPAGFGNADEVTNNDGGTTYISRTPAPQGVAGGAFDDVLVWIPKTVLANRLIAAGKL